MLTALSAWAGVASAALGLLYLLAKWWLSKERRKEKRKTEIKNEIKETVNNGDASDINGLVNDIDRL